MYRYPPLALFLACALGASSMLLADNGAPGPLFMKHLVKEGEFYEPWGIGIDFYTMDQDYKISNLAFDLPGVSLADPSKLLIDNEIQHLDLKLDVWLTPFLNVFGILGHVDGDTMVDFSQASITGLPIPLRELPISYDGAVYGGGVNLVFGSEKWFGAVNTTLTDADIGGDFNTSVSTLSVQPRLGLVRDKWQFWVGGMYLDTEEDHSGTITLPIPGVPPVDFDVELEGSDKWNNAAGIAYTFSPKAHLSLEVGFGNRDHTLFNYTFRF